MECTLLLVDGTAAAYRAFHAIRGLTTAAGLPTNALFGFIRMLEQLERRWAPTHRAVVFDGGLPEARTRLWPDYKAQREPMPDDLRAQLSLIDEYLDAARVPWLLVDGQEADDVLATLSATAAPAGEVLIATSDKDLLQLVGPRVRVVPLTKDGDAAGPEEVRARTGVAPAQIVDWLALTGDAVDNIPGVPGVGPKTAAALLGRFGTLDALLADLARVESAPLRDKLAAHREALARNRRLLRLDDALPLPRGLEAFARHMPDVDKLAAFYDKVEFQAMKRELFDRAQRLF